MSMYDLIYDVDGTLLKTPYDIEGNLLNATYEMNGTPVSNVSFNDSTTVTDVYASDITKTIQGGCIDDAGNIYTASEYGVFVKYNLLSGVQTTATYENGQYGHMNGMTYHPVYDLLYVASQNNTGEVYVFDTSLNLVSTLYAKNLEGNVFNCWNIAYDRLSHRFYAMNGGILYFMDDNFNCIKTGSYDINDWTATRQDIETDGTFIYAVSWDANKIHVFDMSGSLVKSISNSSFSDEPEYLAYEWNSGKFYMGGNSGGYKIRELVFKS